MPDIYDRCLGSAVFLPHAMELAERAAALGATRVLELAAGTGILTGRLVEMLPGARITATDLNPSMVEYGSSRGGGAVWRQADAQNLPFDDALFDLVVCQFGVMFFPDKQAAFADVARVLRPGGRLLFSTWDVIERNDFAAAVDAGAALAFPADSPTFLVRVPYGYHSIELVSSDVAVGGMRLDDITTVVLTGRAESAAQVATGFCYGTPLRMEIEERGDLDAAAQVVSAAATARLGQGSIVGALTAHLVMARR
jgi:SAM-dependent methyltransferase